MIKLFEETRRNIMEIEKLVESKSLDTEIYPLDSFVYNKGFITDLLAELDDCIRVENN